MNGYGKADMDLLRNIPTYTTASLVAELKAIAESGKEAVTEILTINESMGVVLSEAEKRLLTNALDDVFAAIKSIEE